MDESERQYHEVANLFPPMTDGEFDNLKQSIAERGQRDPIWLHPDGRIIDGRHRHRACLELGIVPKFQEWDGMGSLVEFSIDKNMNRRDLTASQRAAIAVVYLPMLEAEARERQGTRTDLAKDNIVAKLPQCSEVDPPAPKSRDTAAKMMGVSPRYVSDAKTLQEDAPDLFSEVQAGTTTIQKAKRAYSKRQKKESPPMPSEKYRVFYADPPWSYGNSGVIGESDNYGHVERHYPSMTIKELCALDVKGMADKDAVLFMWVTSPLLEECFPVIKAWGFEYKTSFVWDKVAHNFGHYNSVRHELLLVCTRGSCTPDNPKLLDSVVSIEKSRRHSEKPEEFRQIIDDLYTHGKRVELFSRTEVPGWDSWGNE